MPWLTEEEYQEAMAEYDRLEEEKQSQANGHARALNPSATSFARAWQEAINEFLPKHKSGEMSLGLFQEALAEVVVEHLQVSLGPRSVNRVMDVFRRHGSRATKEGVISLLQENAPVNKRLQWLEYRAKTSKWSPGKGECQ